MLIGAVRSGLVEARHEVTVVAATPDGVVEATGPIGEPFFLRSAAKPFQAAVSQREGAALGTEQLAMAAASHGGQPVHVAYVRSMLAEVGLNEEHLRCPPARPMSIGADRAAAAAGDREERRAYHNCSGKHTAMLRACAARGWSLEYADPDHPLQQATLAFVAEVTGCDPTPVGVDGCGVPTLRATVACLARGFARLATAPDLAEVNAAMYRYSPLTSDGERGEAVLSRWGAATVKGGAMGCIGVAHQSGLGIAAKCWTGQSEPALMGVVLMMHRLGLLADHPFGELAALASPPVLGGGVRVGSYEVLDG